MQFVRLPENELFIFSISFCMEPRPRREVRKDGRGHGGGVSLFLVFN